MADFREFLLRYLDAPMQWGRDDCSLFIADWWLENHGTDPAAHLRGTYATEGGKAAVVDAAGGLLPLVAGIARSVGARRTRDPQDGDFGLIRHGDTVLAAIRLGGYWAARSEGGVAFTRNARLVRAWSIHRGEQNSHQRQAEWLHAGLSPWSPHDRPWLAPTAPYARDPLSIGIAFLVNIGYTGAISGLGATLLGSAIIGGIGIGLSYLSNAIFSPKSTAPDPQQRQVTLRQSVGARVRHYGRVKTSGSLWFFESRDGLLFNGITLNEGEIFSINQPWLNDVSVALDGNGYVTSLPYAYDGASRPAVQLLFKPGTSTQTVHASLLANFPGEVTPDHRLRGIANVLAIFAEVPQDKIADVYPQLNPTVRVVMQASLVKDVNTGARIWSDSPADVIYDYLTAVDDAGFAYGAGFQADEIDIATFQDRKAVFAQPVPLKAGGTLQRYRLWGSYALNEQMRDVLPRMLATCDGDLYLTNEGKVGLRGGDWTPPVLTLDDRLGHILSHEFGRGTGALAAFNELTTTYIEPELDYQEVEAERWVDVDNVALVGRPITSQISLPMVPHHAQARRLAKIHTAKENPRWQGKVVTNFYGFNAINERTVHVVIDVLGINDDFLIRRLTVLPDMTGVELQLSSLSAEAYEWDAELEEGTGPGQPPDTSTPVSLDPPEDINATAGEREISGGTFGTYLIVTWTPPTRTALSQQVQYRILPGGAWQEMSVSSDDGVAQSPIVDAGFDYAVQVRTRSPGGATGAWTAPITITATADLTAPDPVDNLAVAGGYLSWDQPASINGIGARIYVNSINDFLSATIIDTVYGSPGTSEIYPVSTVPGTYYYFVTAFNGSDVESTSSDTGAVVVT